MHDAGKVIAIADPDAEVESIYDGLTTLASDMSDRGDLRLTTWPIYGPLIASMRHTHDG
ncbi:hypothetical protein [Arthrobacter castelli]|uniref:hypothetical protein n=1 Tax=Arthrobacter castelli TaxID=271431 RepID=UPI000423A6EE|nr:hypothetical protein [Arthrobacter castelli]